MLAAEIAANAALSALCLVSGGITLTRAGAAVSRRAAVSFPLLLFGLAAASGLGNTFGLFAGRPGLASAAYGIVLLLPPAIFVAVRALAGPSPAFRAADLLHALPALVGGLALSVAFADGLGSSAADQARALFWLGFAALALGYFIAAALRIRLGFRMLLDALSYRGSAREARLSFALLLVGMPIAALLLELAAGLLVDIGEGAALVFGLFRMGCIATLAALALEPRQVLLEPEDAPGSSTSPGSSGAYARSPLDSSSVERIVAKLDAAMREVRAYRAPFLSLDELSAATGVSPHRISQVLNQTLGLNFFDFVNQWRIAEACERLSAEPDARIIDIAEAVGFNTKSTFNAAFRKHAGCTPSEWRSGSGRAGAAHDVFAVRSGRPGLPQTGLPTRPARSNVPAGRTGRPGAASDE